MSKNLRYIDRKIIAEGLKLKLSKAEIADTLKVSVTTIYRELNRNTRKSGTYDPKYAHKLALARKKRVGSIAKKKSVQTKKKAYTLYADRRLIKWFSDTTEGRKPKNTFLTPLKWGSAYQVILSKKVFHFYNDFALFALLYYHEGWNFPTIIDVLYSSFLPHLTSNSTFVSSTKAFTPINFIQKNTAA
ncbi:helix-turn-helix domain-containing protein [Sediminitomix flava]|uniref:Helix-turn-helix protein n=1 Tax=Sediminitomix flava TaxID=379075 RepID=A0A315ZHZ7_SEDFL|nr:helix-turn-helix domain-containing protein [Sediminitomix flava]PWJ44438.1 helix-turn-helix protein [Sediminitomix flava]